MLKSMKKKSVEEYLKSLTNPNQKEIFLWLIHHYQQTPLYTWNMLFNQRNSKYPDICIAMYDNLNINERLKVELTFSKFVEDLMND